MGSNDKKCLSKGETTNDVSVYCSRFDAFLPWIWMKVPPPSELKMSSLSFHKLKPLNSGERYIFTTKVCNIFISFFKDTTINLFSIRPSIWIISVIKMKVSGHKYEYL